LRTIFFIIFVYVSGLPADQTRQSRFGPESMRCEL
jgi:hypothetical protein